MEIAIGPVPSGQVPEKPGVTVRFRGLRGAVITVTLDQGIEPADEDEAIGLAKEVISRLAASRAFAPTAANRNAAPLDGGELFRSWALATN